MKTCTRCCLPPFVTHRSDGGGGVLPALFPHLKSCTALFHFTYQRKNCRRREAGEKHPHQTEQKEIQEEGGEVGWWCLVYDPSVPSE